MSLFINGELRKTKKFGEDCLSLIQNVNDEIVLAAGELNLTILNENLETKKTFKYETYEYETDSSDSSGLSVDFMPALNSISGNETFIAVANKYKVFFHRRLVGNQPKVRQTYEYKNYENLLQ